MLQRRSYHPDKSWHYVVMLLGAVAAFYSWKWSFNLLSAMFGDLTGGFLATIVTVVEIVSLRQLILTMRMTWIVGIIPGFIISIAGSYGNFQMEYETNIAKSSEYQRMEQDIQSLIADKDAALKAAQEYDKTKQPWYAKPNRQRADELQRQIEQKESHLKNMTDAGYGSSNALFRSMSRHISGWSVLDSAERSHLFLGIALEFFMLFCTALSAFATKKGIAFIKAKNQDYTAEWDDEDNLIYTKGKTKHVYVDEKKQKPQHNSPPQKFVPEPSMAQKREIGFTPPQQEKKTEPLVRGTGEVLSPGGNGDRDYQAMQQKSLQSRNNSKAHRKRLLKSYLENNPNATLSEMASAIGVSSGGTVRKYLEELGYNPQYKS